ncbi:MAG: DUF4907 domain-containing protein [Ferruginibacter sp.]
MQAKFFLSLFYSLFSFTICIAQINNTTNLDSLKKVATAQKQTLAKQYSKSSLTYFITKVNNQQFGYYIFCDGQLLIDQKTIPAVAGNNGFKNEKDAKNVAALAIKKIKQGEMPPTINVAELKKLKVKL